MERESFIHNQILNPSIIENVKSMLYGVSGRIHKLLKIDEKKTIMCKTGTTNKHRTCWFVGSTKTHTLALYIGRDDNASMDHAYISSARHAAAIGLDILYAL